MLSGAGVPSLRSGQVAQLCPPSGGRAKGPGPRFKPKTVNKAEKPQVSLGLLGMLG